MSAKHTPGPWIVGETTMADREITTQDRLDRSYSPICEMDIFFNGEHGAEQEANSRLIAAAPDLLEALQNVVAWWDKFIPTTNYHAQPECEDAEFAEFQRARYAIAKALGEDQ